MNASEIHVRGKIQMKHTLKRTAALLSAMLLCCTGMQLPKTEQIASAAATNVVEYLDRGINAINTPTSILFGK